MEGIIRDITERKQAERELRKVLKQLRQRVDELDTLNRITRMVASTLDLAIMLNAVCHELGLLFKASSTGVALFNPQQTELTIFADYSINTELPDILGFPLPLKKNHFIRRMLKVGKSVVVSHAQTNPISKPLHDLLCKRDVQSIMLVPLRSRGVIIGVIGINSDEPDRDFTPDEISLAETIAGQVAGAIENAQLFTESKRSETTLLEANKELKDTLENLRRTQAQLIQSEKMAALGQLIAGVAHEINTPLGAIRASIGNIAHAFKETIQHFSEFQQLSPEQIADVMSLVHHVVQEQRVLTSREERQLKKMLRNELHAHGLNSAHELADTLVDMGFYGDLAPFIALFQSEHQTLMMLIAYNLAIQYRNNQNITTAVERAAKIVFALKSYARYDPSAQQTKAVISEGIECVLTLYCNQLKYGIEIIKHYEDVPAIPCYPDELNQVWTNLIHNAIQAMEGQGTLEITVGRRPKVENSSAALHDEDEPISRNHYVVVQITDSGHGIPAELQVRIFEPFFTTKSSGEGSGLGLDICHRIIEKHQGKIEVESQPGKTTFSVWLPV